MLTLVPNAVIALAVVLGAVAVSKHAMTVGGLVAFITLGLQLVWPVEALGYILASGEEAATAAQRVVEIFDTEPAITSDAARKKKMARNGAWSPWWRRRDSRYPAGRVTGRIWGSTPTFCSTMSPSPIRETGTPCSARST